MRPFLLLISLLLAGPFLLAAGNDTDDVSWRDADRSSAELAPAPTDEPRAVIQVYSARAFDWRGNFAVHTWLSSKAPGADHYEVHQVTGWGQPYVRSTQEVPDRAWYGSAPRLLLDIRGDRAETALPKLRAAVATYPWPDLYRAWPGPNSNTFTAWVLRNVPELHSPLPNTAVGKDYLGLRSISGTPGGSGYQLSLFGVLGILAGPRDGLELNLLGLSAGLDPLSLAIKLPGLGHLGMEEPWPVQHLQAP